MSSVELERVLLEELNHSLLEVAAVGVPSPGGGPELLHLFVVRHPSPSSSTLSPAVAAAGGGGGSGASKHRPPFSNSSSSESSPAGGGGGGDGAVSGGSGASKPYTEAELKAACQAVIRTKLNPLFKVDRVVVTEALPRTASNKVMRRVLRDVAMQQQQQGKGQVTSKL